MCVKMGAQVPNPNRKSLSPRRPTDIRAKRRNETWLQWRSRVAYLDQTERDKSEPLVTIEAEGHGDYYDDFVTHAETGTVCRTKRNRQSSSMALLHQRGHIDDDQLAAALEIARVAESIESSVAVRGASMEARVDNSIGMHDVLVERLSAVRLEMTYSAWRNCLPMPRRMVIDMILTDRTLKTTARVHRMGWTLARRRLIGALDLWLKKRDEVWRKVDECDIEAAHRRIG